MSKAVTADDRDDDLITDNSDESVVSILTYGDPIRSWLAAVEPITDECRLRFDSSGMHVKAVDPANVALIDLTAHADGFSRCNVAEDTVVGLNLGRFRKAVSWARKRGGDGDPVTIDVLTDPTQLRVTVARPDQGMKRISEWFAIDTDGIRDEPTMPNLDLPNTADPDVRALKDAIGAIDETAHDYVTVARDDDTLALSAKGDEDSEAIYFPSTAWGDDEDASSFFSIDYLADLTKALKYAKTDRVTLSWGDEFPMVLAFEHEEWGFDGRYCLAPRIQSDG